MSDNLPKSTRIIDKILKEKGLTCEIKEFPSSTRTAQDAANSIGCHLSQIAKSLIFKTKKTSQPVLILASGINRVNEKSIAKVLGDKITKADANFTRENTGFAIGGIPPIGHKEQIPFIFMDESLLTHETVWASAGTPNTVFEISPQMLIEITAAKAICIH